MLECVSVKILFLMKSSSDVVRRKFTPKEVQPTTFPTDHEDKKLASEIKNDRTVAINFQNIEKVKIVDSTENSGFYCKECNLSCKDSVTFLDHLNSRLNQRFFFHLSLNQCHLCIPNISC